MAEFSDYVEARSFVSSLDGTEKMAGSKNGTSVGWTTQQVANLVNTSAFGLVEVDTTGSTITLPFGEGIAAYQRRFYGSAPFATPKTIALSGANANNFTYIFEITDVAATLTFPSGFKSGDTRYNLPSALIWTSNETGIFKITGDKYGSNWIIEFTLFPAV